VLVDCWTYFDGVVDAAPATLRKVARRWPRPDGIVSHVQEAERHYCSKLGMRVPPRTPWVEQRAWSLRRYRRISKRRVALEVLASSSRLARPGYAWEIETRACRTILNCEYSYPRIKNNGPI